MAEPKDGSADELERALRGILADARKLPGCVRSEWYRDPEGDGRYVMHGEFDGMEAFAEYRQSEVVARIGSEFLPLLASEPEFRHYEARVFESG